MTNLKLMMENYPVGTTINYHGNQATIIDYEKDDANPFAILEIKFSQSNLTAMVNLGLHRPNKISLSYNTLVHFETV